MNNGNELICADLISTAVSNTRYLDKIMREKRITPVNREIKSLRHVLYSVNWYKMQATCTSNCIK